MKILVGLSGWVDSAVVAHLLQQQGHEVVWGFMKNYIAEEWTCTTREDAESAIEVAKFLWIELQVFDFQKEYKEQIIQYIFDGYKQWITPNPDILCNNLIKFKLFLDEAIKLGFNKIATGHYANIVRMKSEEEGNNWNLKLLKWLDPTKDQSYFLSWLNQHQLSKSLFPIWNMQKTKVREIAKKIWLPNANRKDSQWLCFIWNIPIKEFLIQKLPIQKWDIIDEEWNVLWQHDGARFFTIGQNRGLKLSHKAYVYKIDVSQNIIHVSKDKESTLLKAKEILLTNWHRIRKNYNFSLQCTAKIRYRQNPQPALLIKEWREENQEWEMKIVFEEEQRGIAPGQSVVAYLEEECIGGGVII